MAAPFSDHDREILAHYGRFLGPPEKIYLIDDMPDTAPNPIMIVEYHESEDMDWMYLTVGMSGQPLNTGDWPVSQEGGYRIELLLFSMKRYPQLAEALALFARYPFVSDTYLARGHTVAGTDGIGIVDGSPLTDIFFTQPHFMDEEFDLIFHADGTHSHVLWSIPVYRAERMLAKNEGSDKLLEAFAENETRAADLWRESAV